MPRLVHSAPKYRRHRPSGQAVVTFAGKDHYLGPWRSKASKVEYDRLIGEWLAAGRCLPRKEQSDLTMAELCLAYLRHAQTYYRTPDNRPSGSLDRIRAAIKLLRGSYGHTLAVDFGPLALQTVLKQLAKTECTRRYCNHLAGAIKRMFKWGASQELLPVEAYQRLATVAGLKAGRTPARDNPPVGPVADDVVQATMPHLPPPVAAMVQVQRLTGCRPGEVCAMRPRDVDRSGAVWKYTPSTHKTTYRGKQRVIFVGPKAQEVLLPWLLRDAAAYCFDPSESEAKRRAERHAARKTPLGYGNRPGTNRKRRPQRAPRPRYDTGSYARAITRGIEQANRQRRHDAEFAQSNSALLPHWSPNQLRHAAATEIRALFGGLESVQAVLGHSHMAVSEVYAEKNLALAEEVMRKIG